MDDQLDELVPSDSRRVYDMRKVITNILDNGDFFDFIADPLEKRPLDSNNLSEEQALVKESLQKVLDNIKKNKSIY